MSFYLNKKTESEYFRLNKLPINKLIKLRKGLDEQLFANKFYLTGLNYPIPVQLNCLWLTRKQAGELFSKSKIIINCISKIVSEYYKSRELQNLIKIDPFEKKLFLSAPRPKGFGMMRLDGFWTGKNFQFVELNSDYPEGVVMFQNSCEVYDKILFNNKTKIDNKELFYNNLIALYNLNGGKKKKPVIAIIGPKNRLFMNEYELLLSFIRKKGHISFLAEPSEIKQTKDGFLRFGNYKIDIIRRAGEIRYFKSQKSAQKIFAAYKKGKVQIINDFHNRLWGIKSVFAILRNKKFHYLFNKEDLGAIKESIPESHILSGNIDDIKNENFWLKKNNYVLKPSDVSEGENILFGKDLSAIKWRKLLSSKNCEGWVVQKMIKLKKRKVLQIQNNKKTTKNLYTDFMVHAFMDKKGKLVFGNMGNRTSESKVVNVSKGGGVALIKIL